MERRFTILALQGRNFRRIPDGLQVIKGGDGGPVQAGRLSGNGQGITFLALACFSWAYIGYGQKDQRGFALSLLF